MNETHPRKLDHPAVWKGNELLARKDWTHQLTDQEREEVLAASRLPVPSTPKFTSPERFPLPHLGKRLHAIRHDLEHGSGATLIQGLPVEDMSEEEARRTFIGLTCWLGIPVSQSSAGDLVFSVRDQGLPKDDPKVRGPITNRRLSFHTDRCDVIGFLCLQQAMTGGENELVSSPALYNEIATLRPDLLEALMQTFVYKRHVVDGGNQAPYCEQPIFSFCQGHFAASFLRVLIDRADEDPDLPNLSETQREALDFLEDTAERPEMHVRFRQQRGDALFLNNWVNFHRRSAFTDWPEPEKRRHLLRIWLSVPNSRPLDPCFLPNFGNVGPGAVRGGMLPAT